MVLFSNLSFVLKVLNLKGTEFSDETVLKLKCYKKLFFWNDFFNILFSTQKYTAPYYPSKALKTDTLISDFCIKNSMQIILHGKTVYNDYEIVGLKFNDSKQKAYFILKFGELLQHCIK